MVLFHLRPDSKTLSTVSRALCLRSVLSQASASAAGAAAGAGAGAGAASGVAVGDAAGAASNGLGDSCCGAAAAGVGGGGAARGVGVGVPPLPSPPLPPLSTSHSGPARSLRADAGVTTPFWLRPLLLRPARPRADSGSMPRTLATSAPRRPSRPSCGTTSSPPSPPPPPPSLPPLPSPRMLPATLAAPRRHLAYPWLRVQRWPSMKRAPAAQPAPSTTHRPYRSPNETACGPVLSCGCWERGGASEGMGRGVGGWVAGEASQAGWRGGRAACGTRSAPAVHTQRPASPPARPPASHPSEGLAAALGGHDPGVSQGGERARLLQRQHRARPLAQQRVRGVAVEGNAVVCGGRGRGGPRLRLSATAARTPARPPSPQPAAAAATLLWRASSPGPRPAPGRHSGGSGGGGWAPTKRLDGLLQHRDVAGGRGVGQPLQRRQVAHEGRQLPRPHLRAMGGKGAGRMCTA